DYFCLIWHNNVWVF
nr:immunoglobulin light chain junction region [Macaca mulatta]